MYSGVEWRSDPLFVVRNGRDGYSRISGRMLSFAKGSALLSATRSWNDFFIVCKASIGKICGS